jgi:hypothetical protein
VNLVGIQPITGPAFSATVRLVDQEITVALIGNGDVRAQDPLETLLTTLHEAAGHLQVREVRIDCRELKFINSSCLKVLVSWIGQVLESAPGSRYQICFATNPTMQWQRRSFSALRAFGADLVRVET